MRVRVRQTIKQFGWYGGKRRYPGDEFEIAGRHELGSWMELIAEPELQEREPEAVTPEPVELPKKRTRRTKVQMLADKSAGI